MQLPSTPRMISRRHFMGLSAGVAGATLGASACNRLTGQVEEAKGEATNFPQRPITMIVCFEAGGGTDVSARLLQPYLEEELQGTVNVVNKPAGGGWVGWNALIAAEPDGHTIGFLNTPNIISGYLNPELEINHDLSDFTLLGNVVTDYGVVAIRPDDRRFGDIDELIAYARDKRLTSTSTGVGSDDELAALGLNHKYGTRFAPVEGEGTAESTALVMGGNIDVLFANVGEVTKLHQDGRLKALAVMASPRQRPPFIPDVPTLAEAGYPGVISWSTRGLGGPKGIPDDIRQTLVKACARSINNKTYVRKSEKQGLLVDYMEPTRFRKFLAIEEKRVKPLGDKYVW